jgi:hypothetical protein
MKQVILSEHTLPNSAPARTDGFAAIGYGLEVCIPEGAQNGDSWEISIEPLKIENPVASTILGQDVFISNAQELLSVIRGNLLQCGCSDYGTHDFRDKSNIHLNHRSDKIATYFNHIFLAIGRTLWWTDLDNYWNWYPAVDSEADFRILEWEKDEITAITTVNDVLFIHFPQSIYECTYVGKPTVVRILRRVTGAGSINSRSLIATKSAMFFLGLENFYIWSVDVGLKEIGQEVWKKFLAASADLQSTWAYHDVRNHEICWVNNSLIWAFNYIEGHWQKYSADGIRAHCTTPYHSAFTSISCGDTDSTIEPDRWEGVENLWVGCWGVAREAKLVDPMAGRLKMETPYLESDDLTYGDIHSYKTTDLVVLDAELKHPWSGIRVLVCGKKRVSQETVWTDAGVWLQTMEHKDFVSVAGKALRFRFEFVDDLIKADGSLTLNGGQRLNGKRLDLLDGTVKLDGTKHPHVAADYEDTSDGVRWFGEVYAWGERTNLPEKLVGPDK